MKFKKGDQVRFVEPGRAMAYPGVHKVLRVTPTYVFLGEDGGEFGGWEHRRFELVRALTPLEEKIYTYIKREQRLLGITPLE